MRIFMQSPWLGLLRRSSHELLFRLHAAAHRNPSALSCHAVCCTRCTHPCLQVINLRAADHRPSRCGCAVSGVQLPASRQRYPCSVPHRAVGLAIYCSRAAAGAVVSGGSGCCSQQEAASDIQVPGVVTAAACCQTAACRHDAGHAPCFPLLLTLLKCCRDLLLLQVLRGGAGEPARHRR